MRNKTERFEPKDSKGEPYSSWVYSVVWNDGVIIIHRYEDSPDDRVIYRYDDENITYGDFLAIKRAYKNNKSIGSVINERLINNTRIGPAKKYEK